MRTRLQIIDEIVLANFNDLFIVEQEKRNAIPIIWATDERAKSWAYSPVLKNEPSVCPITKLRLPYMNLFRHKISRAGNLKIDFTLNAWTRWYDEANQILEQILSKFNSTPPTVVESVLTLWNPEGDKIIGSLKLNSCTNQTENEKEHLHWCFDLSVYLVDGLEGIPLK